MRRQLGENFERFDAIDGAAVPANFANQFANPGDLSPNEIGCYASHLGVAEQIVSRGLPYAVVLEDDAALDADLLEVVEMALGSLSQWDVISLSGAKQRPHLRLSAVGSRHLVRFLQFPKTTAAYVLSNSGARKLLKERRRFRPIDVDIRYGWEMNIEGYGIFPPPAVQSGLPSSIPRSGQRFYWRSAPLSYLRGRLAGIRKLGFIGLIQAGIHWPD